MVERTGPRAAFEQFGTLLYLTCVDFMLRLGALLGLSYRDTNALVLLVGMPAVVVTLAGIRLSRRWRRS